jgi:hypothetical protein
VLMNFDQYQMDVWNGLPISVVSDEYYDKNSELFQSIIYEFYRLYDKYDGRKYTVSETIKSIEVVFSGILKFGLR